MAISPKKLSVEKQKTITLDINDPQGQAWDGHHLWLADDDTDSIYKINPSSGKVMKTIPAPGTQPRGLAWDGKNLWCSDNNTKKIYKINPKNGGIISAVNAPVSYAVNAPEDTIRGLAWDGKYLWSAYYAGWGSQISQVEPDTGDIVKSFFPGGIPQELECDGEYLYCVNNNNYLKKKNYDNFNIIRCFQLSSLLLSSYIEIPSTNPRGTAFDGEKFWHVDKNSKRLSQLIVKN